MISEETAGRFRVWVFVDSIPALAWDRKVEGGFPELKVLVEAVPPCSLEISRAHDRVWTETTNQGQDSTRKVPGSLGRWITLVDRLYVIVGEGGQGWTTEMSCLSSTCRGITLLFESCQRRHWLTVRDTTHSPSTQPSRKLCALTHRWMVREYLSSSTRQSPTVSPGPPTSLQSA